MKTSRSLRLAKRCALLFVLALPFLLGANEEGWSSPDELPPIPRPSLSPWFIGCKQITFSATGAQVSDFESANNCPSSQFAQPKFHRNSDPRCTGNNDPPAFHIADGVIYDAALTPSIELKQWFGEKIPNAPAAPIVSIPGTNLVYVFFGYAPEPGTEESPQAFFVALDAEAFRAKPDYTSIRALFPLDIGPKENAGCGTIRLAAVDSGDDLQASATVFVSTCSFDYGFRVTEKAGQGFVRERFFKEELPAHVANPFTSHRAEMEVVPTKNGYAVFWPFEYKDGAPGISATLLLRNGRHQSHRELSLGGALGKSSVKGLEIARNWRSFFVTSPGASNSLFQFPLFNMDPDVDNIEEIWPTSMQPLATFALDDIGISQIQTGADGVMRVLEKTHIVPVPTNSTILDPVDAGIDLTFYGNGGSDDPIRLLPPVTRGASHGCDSWAAAMDSSGKNGGDAAGGMNGSSGLGGAGGIMGAASSSGAGNTGGFGGMSGSGGSSSMGGGGSAMMSSTGSSGATSTSGAGGVGGAMNGSSSSSGAMSTGGTGGVGGDMNGSSSSSGATSTSGAGGTGGDMNGSSSSSGTGGGGCNMPLAEDCANMVDDDCDGAVDCWDSECAMAQSCFISISSVDYPVIAMGGKLVITGQGFTNATGVSIGGTTQSFVIDNDNQVTIASVQDSTPIGPQNLVITNANGASMPFGVTVIRLQINELDSDQAGTDTTEFVEISTGVPNVNLQGYSLVAFNGASGYAPNYPSYLTIHLNGTTDANGLLLVGNSSVVPPVAFPFANNTLQNGPDAVGIFQAFPQSFPLGTIATASQLIDVLVYDTGSGDEEPLLNIFFGPLGTPGRVQVDETTAHPVSIQRCGNGRRDGSKYLIGAPTPGAINNVAACPP